jgi:hypothetical protein
MPTKGQTTMTNLLNVLENGKTLTLKAAKENAGEISTRNSKMPGSSFAISAKHCNVGGKLASIRDSVCSKCYALKLQNMRPSVDQGWTSNYLKATRLIESNPEQWARAVAFQILKAADKTGESFHRWFDSGDLQSLAMLRAIVMAAEATPTVAHWLPTREAAIVKAYRKTYGDFPSNLVVRVSSTMIGDAPIVGHAHTSTVHRKGAVPHGHVCPSTSKEHRALREDGAANCGPCRACWSHEVENVSYPLH